MSNIWNLKDPLRAGYVWLAHSGRELYGTVVRAGRMKKTVSVKNLIAFYSNFRLKSIASITF